MELLAPAGSKEAFYAALASGADAVYFGTDQLNARRLAQNIKQADVADLTRLAHLFGAKVYLALNTIVLEQEFDTAIELVARVWKDGVDAIIVQDFGLIAHLREYMPQVRIHASTQMNIHASDSVRALADLGVARVTLAREVAISDIEVLCAVGREAGIEVEVFGHGALCVCYSGQCLFSSLVGRRSANRGMCAQPCRLAYELIDHRSDVHQTKGPYLLSSKDLSTLDFVQRLETAGVASLKIEGRMKKPAYVAAVVGAYRDALDGDLQEGDEAVLTDAFNRALTSGFLNSQHGERLMDYHRIKNETTDKVQGELNRAADSLVSEMASYQEPLDFEVEIKVGQPLKVTVTDELGNTGSYVGSPVEVARTKPLTEEDVRAHIDRLGNTPYEMDDFKLSLDSGAGMGFSTIHKARREAIADYEARRFFGGATRVEASINVARNNALRDSLPTRKVKRSLNPQIVAVVGSLSAARAVLNAGANEAHINAWHLGEAGEADFDAPDVASTEGIVPVLPRVAMNSELDTYYGIAERFGTAVCSTLGQLATCLERGIPAQAHWSLNVTNPHAVKALQDKYAPVHIWLSPELSGRQIHGIAQRSTAALGTGFFGQQEVMITEACILEGLTDPNNPCAQSCVDCKRRKRHYALRDKKGYCFPVSSDPFGRSHVYNSVPLDLTGAFGELLDSGIAALRLDLENALNTQAAKEVARARRNLIAMAGDGELELPHKPETVTKGHFFRGVV